jgi:hypothetical protein
MVHSPFDRLCFALFVACLPYVWKLDKAYFAYAIGSGLVPAMSNSFFSYTRMLTLCFPFFVVLGMKLDPGKRPRIFWFTVVVSSYLQLSLLLRHVNFGWAG